MKIGEAIGSALGIRLGLDGLNAFGESTIGFGKQCTDFANRIGMSTTAYQVMGEVARETAFDAESMTAIMHLENKLLFHD